MKGEARCVRGSGIRFVFKTRYRKNRGLYFSVALGLFALYAAIHLLPESTWVNTPWVHEFDWLLPLVGVIVLVIAVVRLIAGRVPNVQCSERNVKIQTPFYPVFSLNPDGEMRSRKPIK